MEKHNIIIIALVISLLTSGCGTKSLTESDSVSTNDLKESSSVFASKASSCNLRDVGSGNFFASTASRGEVSIASTASHGEVSTASEIPKTKGAMTLLAEAAYKDLLKHWWDDNAWHIRKVSNGLPSEIQVMIWDHAGMVFAMNTLYEATGDQDIRSRIIAEWSFIKRNFSYTAMTTAGDGPNWALDDTAWSVLAYMVFYRYTGDEIALNAARDLIRDAFVHFKDGRTSDGLLYDHNMTDPTKRTKSIHQATLLMGVFDYLSIRNDAAMLADAMNIYNWIQTNMLRKGTFTYNTTQTGFCDDMLYWAFYNKERQASFVFTGPGNPLNPYDIRETNDKVMLGGVMAMGVVHARLYKRTGDIKYLERAQETLRAVNDNAYIVKQGVYVNVGDAWANMAAAREWVNEVLVLPGRKDKDVQILKDTAVSIYNFARTPDGFYSANWSGPADDRGTPWGKKGWTSDKIMTNNCSVGMLIAAALAESKGI